MGEKELAANLHGVVIGASIASVITPLSGVGAYAFYGVLLALLCVSYYFDAKNRGEASG